MNIARFGAIIGLFSLAGCLVPQMAMNARERGDSFFEHGHYEAAVYYYSRAIRADPKDHRAYTGRAMAYSHGADVGDAPGGKRGSNLPAALADYDSAIPLQPGDAQLYLNRAVVRAVAGQPDAALSDIDRAIELDPSDGLSHGYRGLVLLRSGRDAEAQTELDRCVQLAPASRRELDQHVKRIKARRTVPSA